MREKLQKHRFKIRLFICAILLLYLIYGCVYAGKTILINSNDKKSAKVLESITYTEDYAEDEMDKLEVCADEKNLSNSMKGSLYKALAELSYMSGDDILYNKYVAIALYYLEKENAVQDVVYLTNKYMGRLYANGCYKDAEELLSDLSKKYTISELPVDIQASYYLSWADLVQMLGRSDGEYLKEAQSAISSMKEGSERKLNQGKYDILNVRNAIVNDKWQEAEKILSNYSESESFGYEENQVYVICDFRIPYEEMKAKISLYNKDLKSAKLHINNYIKFCEQFNFRAMELHLLQYVNEQCEGENLQEYEYYDELEKTISKRILTEITTDYAQVLLTDMNSTQNNLEVDDKTLSEQQGIIIAVVIILNLIIIIVFFIALLVDYLERDTLTKLDNRKKYEKLRQECDRKRIPYGFIMIDIDDFKKVNDTLGHQTGDVVLSEIAGIILNYTGRGIEAFRYGGEEICMMLLRVSEQRTCEIAEEIRVKVEQTSVVETMKITISGGVSMSENGENVFVNADQNLYEEKSNGKNQIRH